MRNEHDLICSWVFDKDPQSRSLLKVLTKWIVTICMLRSDVLQRNGLGPTAWLSDPRNMQRLGLEDIAADLAAHNLLPCKEWVR